MRNALNNLQSTFSGFEIINADNVFKVCDQPHPKLVRHIIGQCAKGEMVSALAAMEGRRPTINPPRSACGLTALYRFVQSGLFRQRHRLHLLPRVQVFRNGRPAEAPLREGSSSAAPSTFS